MSEIDREKLLSIAIKKYSKEADKRDRELAGDLDAYKRLRRQGLQPPRIDGCKTLEAQAVTRDEIQTGALLPGVAPSERKKMAQERREAQDRAREWIETHQ